MFSLPYFWTFIFGSFFTFMLLRHHSRFRGESETVKIALGAVGNLCQISIYVFLVLGFWFMPKWWYPLVFYVVPLALYGIPIPDWILSLIGLVAAPLLMILSYVFLFA